MIKGERMKGDSQEEKDCLQLIHDIDHIGGHVKGSITSKKYTRNEIWDSGALNIKKGESMLNTVTAEVTYLIRSNTDVTSLLSGTAIKAVVAYVSDYISKLALKTY